MTLSIGYVWGKLHSVSDFGSVLTPHFHRKGGTCFDFMELHIKITLRQIQQFGERIDGEPRQHNDLLGPLHPTIDTKSENGKLSKFAKWNVVMALKFTSSGFLFWCIHYYHSTLFRITLRTVCY